MGAKVIIYFDHATLKYLLTKKDAKPHLIKMDFITPRIFVLEVKDKRE